MSHYINLKNCFIALTVLATSLLTTHPANGSNISGKGNQLYTVIDETGKPVPGARVTCGGLVRNTTDDRGTFSLEENLTGVVTITGEGYRDFYLNPEQQVTPQTIVLEKGETAGDNRPVPLPFMKVKKNITTGSSTFINGEEMAKFPTNDVRNALSGMFSGTRVREMHGQPGTSALEIENIDPEKIFLYIRGKNPVFIIDDVMVDITEWQLSDTEIESVTIMKDIVAKSMFGPRASDGAVFIKTKTGKQEDQKITVNLESGVAVTDRFPAWSSGADYARLNNTARINSGAEALYSESEIAEYARNNPYDFKFPSTNYRDIMLDNNKSFRKASVISTGGNENVQYFGHFGYKGEGDIYKLGHTANYNALNARSNIDLRLTDDLHMIFRIMGGISYRPRSNYTFPTLLSNINTYSPIAFPVYAGQDPLTGKHWYGIDPNYTNNPVGELEGGGYRVESGRNGGANIAMNYDLSKIVKGLVSKTSFNFDVFNLLHLGKTLEYDAFITTPSTTSQGKDTVLLTRVLTATSADTESRQYEHFSQRFGGYQSFEYTNTFGENFLNASLTGYISKVSYRRVTQPERIQNFMFSALYSYNEKYTIHGTLNYSGTYILAPGKRYDWFPAVGVSWVVSRENFMEGVSFIDFLKLRAEAGILGDEAGFRLPYYYRDRWTRGTINYFGASTNTPYWFGSDTENPYAAVYARIGNPDLTWEKRKEFNMGLDASMFNNKLTFELNYYNHLNDGVITSMNNILTYTSGIAYPEYYENYNKTRYYGVETSIMLSDKSGDFGYTIGGSVSYQDSKILKYDEPDYRFDYQSRVGKPADGYWGLTSIGKFKSKEETLVVPQLFDESLEAGDLKYKDLNNDGFIDDNDKLMVGETSPDLIYFLNVNLSYRNFDLKMTAEGIALVDLATTNSFFWNGWGDNNFSEFVRDNIGGAYPRLTYYKVNNNFQASDFWLTNGGYLKLKNVEIGYNMPQNVVKSLNLKGLRLFVHGSNLLTFTGVKYVDPEAPDSGISNYPLFRTFSGGIKVSF